MKTTSLQLPISQSGCGNTRLISDGVSLTIEFEYREAGRDLIGCLRFSEVIAYTFRNEMHSQGYLSEAYDAVHEVPESSWLQQMKDAAPNGVRDADSKRHFAVFLSSNGYFEVLAGSYVFEALREGFLE